MRGDCLPYVHSQRYYTLLLCFDYGLDFKFYLMHFFLNNARCFVCTGSIFLFNNEQGGKA